jgi:hypothetical protein
MDAMTKKERQMAEIQVICWRCKGKCQEFGWAKPGDTKQTWQACPSCEGKGWVMGTIMEGGYVRVDRRPPEESPQEALQQLTREFLEDLSGSPIRDITDQIATSNET